MGGGVGTQSLGMYPHGESNLPPFGVWDNAPTTLARAALCFWYQAGLYRFLWILLWLLGSYMACLQKGLCDNPKSSINARSRNINWSSIILNNIGLFLSQSWSLYLNFEAISVKLFTAEKKWIKWYTVSFHFLWMFHWNITDFARVFS